MKVDIEAIWIYALTVLLSAYMYLNFTGMRSQVIFYFMVSTGSVLTIISLGRKEPYVDPRKIGEALMYTVLNMWTWALLFQILTAKFGIGMVTMPLPTETRQLLLNAGVPLMYFFLVGAGETLFYVGIPLSLSRSLRHYGKFRYVPAIVLHIIMAAMFATMHLKAYPSLFLLLQPFMAGLINTYIAIWKKNISGIMLGHFIIDYLIAVVGIL